MEHSRYNKDKSWALFFFEKRHRVSYAPFWLFILLALGLFSLILFVRVDVSVRGKGIVKTGRNTSELRIGVAGKVLSVAASENENVKKGDTLCVIDHSSLISRGALFQEQIDLNKDYSSDLYWLTRKPMLADSLKTSRFKQSRALYQQIEQQLSTTFSQKEKAWKRAHFLLTEKVLSQADFELIESEYLLAKENIENHHETYLEQWMSQYVELNTSINDLAGQLEQIQETISRHFIRAPESGTLISLQGIQPGHFVSEGTLLGSLSPEGPEEIECFLSPSDIGLLKPGMPVKLQIDAYDYNQWGLLDGELTEIAGDVVTMGNDVYYKVWCHPSKNWLELRNGVRGNIKKGMTVTARFVVTQRTIFQLLFDKMDDWLNPQVAPFDNPLTQTT
jgi:HlyD family secretion protein